MHLCRLGALTRINALTVCKGAEHGWPAGSFSCIEILLALHHCCPDVVEIVLSKGHAAAAQYAVLYGCGHMDASALKSYKLGAGCPEAHADIVCDTGSLGQCLSTVAGMAATARSERFAVVLGDGELQEGQVYEALMTLRHHGLRNVYSSLSARDHRHLLTFVMCNSVFPAVRRHRHQPINLRQPSSVRTLL